MKPANRNESFSVSQLTYDVFLLGVFYNSCAFIFFRSFAPPARDEESETQRKAHAKRVRETRRSTQGVTLDEIKSAEQLVKLKNATNNGNVSIELLTQ